MKVFRSLLYAAGHQPKQMEEARSYGADALIIDLEDRVPRDQKAEARAITREYIEKHGGESVIYVRVNGLESGMLRDDLDAVVVAGLEGIAIPKVDSPDTVRAVDSLIGEVERARGLPPGSTQISAGLESARGVYFAYDICSASHRVSSIAAGFGRGGDLETDVGYLWSEEGTESFHIKTSVLLAARAAGVVNPLDGAYGSSRTYAPPGTRPG